MTSNVKDYNFQNSNYITVTNSSKYFMVMCMCDKSGQVALATSQKAKRRMEDEEEKHTFNSCHYFESKMQRTLSSTVNFVRAAKYCQLQKIHLIY